MICAMNINTINITKGETIRHYMPVALPMALPKETNLSNETLDLAANLKEIQKAEEYVNYTMNEHLAKSRLPETTGQMTQVLQL